ncbi:MAG TPA: hypothetical protein VL991_13250 [Terracidiphilus sp.]|nr:hypothetical protein [Terracidiphilus sp.]
MKRSALSSHGHAFGSETCESTSPDSRDGNPFGSSGCHYFHYLSEW